MRVRKQDLIRIIQMINHTLPFIKPIAIDNGLAFVVAFEVHGHTDGIGFGMELGTDHVFVEANSHYCSF